MKGIVLLTLNINSMAFNLKTDGVRIVNDGKFLIATMPNGDIIPMQVDMIIENDVSHGGFIGVNVTLKTMIPTEQFEILKKSQ